MNIYKISSDKLEVDCRFVVRGEEEYIFTLVGR